MRALIPKGGGEGTPYDVPELEGGLRRANAGEGVMFSLISYSVGSKTAEWCRFRVRVGLSLEIGFRVRVRVLRLGLGLGFYG